MTFKDTNGGRHVCVGDLLKDRTSISTATWQAHHTKCLSAVDFLNFQDKFNEQSDDAASSLPSDTLKYTYDVRIYRRDHLAGNLVHPACLKLRCMEETICPHAQDKLLQFHNTSAGHTPKQISH